MSAIRAASSIASGPDREGAPFERRSSTARTSVCSAASSCDDCRMDVPDVQYARSGDVDIAYQVVGEGPLTVVFVQGWVSNVEWACALRGSQRVAASGGVSL